MIDAWDVYWVMQLDSIASAMFWLPFSVVAVATGLTVVSEGVVVWDYDKKKLHGWVKPAIAGCSLAFLACVFVPSSKTAAAMIVLPAVTSGSAVQAVAPEVRELYELAKGALRSVAKDKTSAAVEDTAQRSDK